MDRWEQMYRMEQDWTRWFRFYARRGYPEGMAERYADVVVSIIYADIEEQEQQPVRRLIFQDPEPVNTTQDTAPAA